MSESPMHTKVGTVTLGTPAFKTSTQAVKSSRPEPTRRISLEFLGVSAQSAEPCSGASHEGAQSCIWNRRTPRCVARSCRSRSSPTKHEKFQVACA